MTTPNLSPGTIKEHSFAELDALYTEAESVDKDVFAEQRSNILLIAGDHYTKKKSDFYKRVRDAKNLSDEQKLRLTKNHVQKIHKTYVNNIVSIAPGVGIDPKNPSENGDQKSATMNHDVWQDGCDKYGIQDTLVDDFADSYMGVGEVAVKLFWDPTMGKPKAYHQAVGEDDQPLFMEDGTPAPDYQKAINEGAFVIEEIYGFNLLRDPGAKRVKESPYLINRKMAGEKALAKQFSGTLSEDEIKKLITASMDETMVIFDADKGKYQRAKDQVLVREFYFRPCAQYPKGYFFFTTKQGILAKGELPGGVFPIIYEPCETFPTSARGRSPIKTMRPYQAEINRAASKMAEHQITLGDDKIMMTNGGTLSPAQVLPGVRGYSVTGGAPVVMEGRNGAQYLEYMNSNISELYQVMSVAEDSLEKNGQLDPYTLLYRSASQKKKFQKYIRGFERFLVAFCKTYLELAKVHFTDDQVVYATGSNERVNISEFKSTTDLCYKIRIRAQSDDIETKMGKQLVMNHMLQFAGSQLKPEDLGRILRNMPYANVDESFQDLTMNYDTALNVILAFDRGEVPPVHKYDDHVYMAKKLASRTQKSDFGYLQPQIQQAYFQRISEHEQFETERMLAVQRAEQGFIPTGGYLVVCDLYMPDPTNPEKTKRARLPYESLQWLVKQLEAQGQGLDQFVGQPGVQNDFASMLNQQMGPPGLPPNGMGGPGGPTPAPMRGMPGPAMPPNGMGRMMGQPGAGMPPGVAHVQPRPGRFS